MMIGDLDPVLVRTFLTVVEERNLTAAGRRLFRTQPAITMQIKRLEAALGRHLFVRNSRKFSLTHDGELLLPYARELIRVNDAARAFLSKPTVEGRVVLGTSDLYAASVLPSVLRQFNRNFPKVELLLRCMLSSKLHKAVSNGDVDLAVVTKLPGNEKGTFLRKEALVWVAHKDFVVDSKEDIPLAMLPEGIFREMALDALNSVGRSYKIAWTSDSIAGLQAAIFSGLAISVLIRPAVNPEMKILGESSGLPPLGQIDLVLRSGGKDLSPAGDTLSRHIVETLGGKGIEQPHP